MGMELLIGIIAVAVIAILWALRNDMKADQNNDGKIDAEDAKIIAEKVAAEAKVVSSFVGDKVAEVKETAKAVKKSVTKKAPAKKKVAAPKTKAAPKKKVAPAKKKAAPKK